MGSAWRTVPRAEARPARHTGAARRAAPDAPRARRRAAVSGWALALLLAAGGLALAAPGSGALRAQEPPPGPPQVVGGAELYRLRIVNRAEAPIEVSLDAGETWAAFGQVVHPVAETVPGDPVFSERPAATVVEMEPGFLSIRVPSLAETPQVLSLAAEGTPRAPGLLVTGIPAGGPLFRSLAPPCGSQVFLEREGELGPLPLGYAPEEGDALVIAALQSSAAPEQVVIENREGGAVTAHGPGERDRLIGRVRQPLRGIGRYLGTERAGAGAVLCWRPATVLVSTAGRLRRVGADGNLLEVRGGFVIQPAEREEAAIHPDSQLLIEAAAEPGGRQPPCSSFFLLPLGVGSGVPIDPSPTRVEVRIDGGDWEPLPDLRGPVDAAEFPARLAEAFGGEREVTEGITHLRVLTGERDPDLIRHAVRLATTPRSGESVHRGQVTVNAALDGNEIRAVTFALNGRVRAVLDRPPFSWEWDTTTAPNGEHLLEIRGFNQQAALVHSVLIRVVVDN